MNETYTEAELARAWSEVDSLLGEDYRNERLAKICLQARKNRLWEAHGNEFAPDGPVPPESAGGEVSLPPRNHPYPFSSVGVKVIRSEND